MSIKIMSRVWEESKQGGSELLLLLAIADNANDIGYAWPGQDYLARKIRMNKRTVPRLTKKLSEAGELFINDRSDRGKSTQYIVLTGMSWADFAKSLQSHLNYTDEQCTEIYPWFCDRGDDKLSGGGMTNCQGGDDKLSGGGMTNCQGGVDMAVSTEPSLTVNEPSFNNGSAKKSLSYTEKNELNKLAPYFAEQCDSQFTRDELKDYIRLGYQMSKEICPLNITGASPKSLLQNHYRTWHGRPKL
jgi:DNA-binding MarR family transcriptional regulator